MPPRREPKEPLEGFTAEPSGRVSLKRQKTFSTRVKPQHRPCLIPKFGFRQQTQGGSVELCVRIKAEKV